MSNLDPNFDKDTQLEALVQLRIYQDRVLYYRINVHLIMNSMLFLIYILTMLYKPGEVLGMVIALLGLIVNYFTRDTLMRQNQVLVDNIELLNKIWTVHKNLEEQWNRYPLADHTTTKKIAHGRQFLTDIVPRGYAVLWGFALAYATFRTNFPFAKIAEAITQHQ